MNQGLEKLKEGVVPVLQRIRKFLHFVFMLINEFYVHMYVMLLYLSIMC